MVRELLIIVLGACLIAAGMYIGFDEDVVTPVEDKNYIIHTGIITGIDLTEIGIISGFENGEVLLLLQNDKCGKFVLARRAKYVNIIEVVEVELKRPEVKDTCKFDYYHCPNTGKLIYFDR